MGANPNSHPNKTKENELKPNIHLTEIFLMIERRLSIIEYLAQLSQNEIIDLMHEVEEFKNESRIAYNKHLEPIVTKFTIKPSKLTRVIQSDLVEDYKLIVEVKNLDSVLEAKLTESKWIPKTSKK